MHRRVVFCVVGVTIIAILGGAVHQATRPVPKYCQVRFGNPPTCSVILERTPDSLLVYRNGDIRSKPERYLFKEGRLGEGVTIPSVEGRNGVSYTIESVSEYTDDEPSPRHALMLFVAVEGDPSFAQYCDVELGESIDDLKVAHFDGPLSIGPVVVNWEIPAGLQFVIGGEPTDVRTIVATLDKQSGCWTVVQSGDDEFPDGTHPRVTVKFPAANAEGFVVQAYPLDQFC